MCLRRCDAGGWKTIATTAPLRRRIGAASAETRAVDHLQAAGELTPGELGDGLSLTSGAVTALSTASSAPAGSPRSPHPDDRRSVVLRLGRAAPTS